MARPVEHETACHPSLCDAEGRARSLPIAGEYSGVSVCLVSTVCVGCNALETQRRGAAETERMPRGRATADV